MNKIIIFILLTSSIYAKFQTSVYMPNMQFILDIAFEYIDKNGNENTKNIEVSQYNFSKKILFSEMKLSNCQTYIKLNNPKEIAYINIVFNNKNNQEEEKEIKIAKSNKAIKNNQLYICNTAGQEVMKKKFYPKTQTQKQTNKPKVSKGNQNFFSFTKPSVKDTTTRLTETNIDKPKTRQNLYKQSSSRATLPILGADSKFNSKISSSNLRVEYFEEQDNIFINIKGCNGDCDIIDELDDNKAIFKFTNMPTNERTIKQSKGSIVRIEIGYSAGRNEHNWLVVETDLKIEKIEEVLYRTKIIEKLGRYRRVQDQITYRIKVE